MKPKKYRLIADTPLGEDYAELEMSKDNDTYICRIIRSESIIKFDSFDKIDNYYIGSVYTEIPIPCKIKVTFIKDRNYINGLFFIDNFCSIKFNGELINNE